MSLIKILDGTPIESMTKGSEKKVLLICDLCSQKTITTYNNFYNSQKRKNFSGITICRVCSSKQSANKRKGKIPWNKGIKRTDISGHNSPNWKGGKYISSDGYIMIKVADRFDVATPWKSYKKEHTHVMETYLGRPLNKGEIIHHLDKNKINNALDNLWLSNQAKHRVAHDSLEKLSIKLYKNGFVIFNLETGIYEFTEEFIKLCKLK
jgi:hypothetical protein